MSSPPLLAFYGDDFTGSTDALEFFERAGIHTGLFVDPPTPEALARHAGLQAVGVAGMTRAMAPDPIEATLRPALVALRSLGARHVHYKVCSTFDSSPSVGSIGRAIDVARDSFRARFVPLVVGAPALGRYCVFGNLFARLGAGRGIYRLDRHPSMSRHPVTPADESDLRLHLAKQTRKRIGLVDVLDLARSEPETAAALERTVSDGAEIVLFDVLEEAHLARIGALLDAEAGRSEPLFTVGSSAVEMALAAHWTRRGRVHTVDRWPDPGPAKPLLVASGSLSPVTAAQIGWATRHDFAEVIVNPASASNTGADAEAARAVEVGIGHLRAGRNLVVHAAAPAEGEHGRSTVTAGMILGRTVRAILADVLVKRMIIAGGDTASEAARVLGIEAAEMIAPLAPGAPLCRVRAPNSPADGLEINFKGGQVGGEDYFAAVARGRL